VSAEETGTSRAGHHQPNTARMYAFHLIGMTFVRHSTLESDINTSQFTAEYLVNIF